MPFQTLLLWVVSFGAKTTCQFIKLYPSYFLLGIFSPFMVSGEVQNEGKIKTMSISTKWTLINFILSIIGSVSGYLVYEFGWYGGYREIHEIVIVASVAFLPTFVPAAICLAILFCQTCFPANVLICSGQLFFPAKCFFFLKCFFPDMCSGHFL